jgi:hypothetical protein
MHGCHNRVPSSTYLVQDGWTEDGRRIMKAHKDVFVVDGELLCKYKNEHPNDSGCDGCKLKS